MKVPAVCVFISVLAQLLEHCELARILGVFPFPSISHQVVFRALVEQLAKRGHHIVTITADPLGAEAPEHYQNVTEIDVHDISYELWSRSLTDMKSHSDPITGYRKGYETLLEVADAQLSTPQLKSLLTSNIKFDLVFAEALFPMSFAYAHHFKAPLIGISSMTALVKTYDAVGNPTHPLLYPEFAGEFIGELNFWKKLRILRIYLTQIYDNYGLSLTFNDIARKHFGNDVPSIFELQSKMDMLFINANPILHGVRPTVPAVVYMGNMHIRPKKKLPRNLKTILDQSRQGVIYFSLGSNVKSKDLPQHIQRSMLAALAELPYTVLWKFENDTLQGRPHNVHISKWFPQNDVLGHPNIKAFITQGGQQSMEEAINNKIPLIGIPFFGDQPINVQKMVELGIGLALHLSTLNKQSFKETIIKVAEGKSYHKNVARVSELLVDSPMTGMERAVWWTEYVLRHGGARHLRAPAADVSWYEYFMLDVLVKLLLLTFVVLVLLYISIIVLIRLFLMTFSNGYKLKTQ